jgi:hypothetical protein
LQQKDDDDDEEVEEEEEEKEVEDDDEESPSKKANKGKEGKPLKLQKDKDGYWAEASRNDFLKITLEI